MSFFKRFFSLFFVMGFSMVSSIYAEENYTKFDSVFVEVQEGRRIRLDELLQYQLNNPWYRYRLSAPSRHRQLLSFYENTEAIYSFSEENDVAFPGAVKIVSDPREGFLSKIMLIRRAKYTIDMTTFIWVDDLIGRAIIAELLKALERGVSVRLIVDAVGSKDLTLGYWYFKTLINGKRGKVLDMDGNLYRSAADGKHRLAHADVRVFNPPQIDTGEKDYTTEKRWRRFLARAEKMITKVKGVKDHPEVWENRRMHDKILMIDAMYPERAMAIIGGRNISEDYYGIPKLTPTTFFDMEVLVKQNASTVDLWQRMGKHFERLFYHLGNRVLANSRLKLKPSVKKLKLRQFKIAEKRTIHNPKVAKKLAQMEQGEYLDKGFIDADVDFVDEIQNIYRRHAFYDPENPKNRKNGNSILAHARGALATTYNHVKIISPYLYLEPDEIKALQAWLDADKSRKLTIVANSLDTTDNFPTQAYVDHYVAPAFMTSDWAKKRVKADGGIRRAKVYAFGKLDSVDYGGKEHYGKLHAKYYLTDDDEVFIGTANFDGRSRYLNSESGVIIHSKNASKVLADEFDKTIKKSYLWGSDDWKKLRKKKRSLVWLVKSLWRLINTFNLAPLL